MFRGGGIRSMFGPMGGGGGMSRGGGMRPMARGGMPGMSGGMGQPFDPWQASRDFGQPQTMTDTPMGSGGMRGMSEGSGGGPSGSFDPWAASRAFAQGAPAGEPMGGGMGRGGMPQISRGGSMSPTPGMSEGSGGGPSSFGDVGQPMGDMVLFGDPADRMGGMGGMGGMGRGGVPEISRGGPMPGLSSISQSLQDRMRSLGAPMGGRPMPMGGMGAGSALGSMFGRRFTNGY